MTAAILGTNWLPWNWKSGMYLCRPIRKLYNDRSAIIWRIRPGLSPSRRLAVLLERLRATMAAYLTTVLASGSGPGCGSRPKPPCEGWLAPRPAVPEWRRHRPSAPSVRERSSGPGSAIQMKFRGGLVRRSSPRERFHDDLLGKHVRAMFVSASICHFPNESILRNGGCGDGVECSRSVTSSLAVFVLFYNNDGEPEDTILPCFSRMVRLASRRTASRRDSRSGWGSATLR